MSDGVSALLAVY